MKKSFFDKQFLFFLIISVFLLIIIYGQNSKGVLSPIDSYDKSILLTSQLSCGSKITEDALYTKGTSADGSAGYQLLLNPVPNIFYRKHISAGFNYNLQDEMRSARFLANRRCEDNLIKKGTSPDGKPINYDFSCSDDKRICSQNGGIGCNEFGPKIKTIGSIGPNPYPIISSNCKDDLVDISEERWWVSSNGGDWVPEDVKIENHLISCSCEISETIQTQTEHGCQDCIIPKKTD